MSYESHEPCICCGRQESGFVCYHHLYTRKAYPEFSEREWNKIPVCQEHHNQFHNKGIDFMARKFKSVEQWLEKNNWLRLSLTKKWVHKSRDI